MTWNHLLPTVASRSVWLIWAVLPLIASAAGSDDWIARTGATVTRDARGQITAVSFRSSWIGDGDLKPLRTLPALRVVDLSHTRITDIAFQDVKALAPVEEVNLYYAEQVGDGALVILKGWKNLKRLNLRGTKVTDLGVAQLAGHPALEAIDVGYSLFTDNGFESLAAIPNLRRVAVGGNKVTDVGLNVLRLLPNLEAVDLAGTQRTDSGPWSSAVSDKGLETLAQLRQLRELNLRSHKLTDAGMPWLGKLPHLAVLDLGQTPISARGLESLSNTASLRSLTLWKCARIGDDAVAVLSRMTQLEWLDVEDSSITPDGLARLKAALPKTRVKSR